MKKVWIISLIVLMFFTVSCNRNQTVPVAEISSNPTPSPSREVKPLPVVLKQKDLDVNGRKNKAFILEIDLKDDRVNVKPYLSFDKIYGFETLTDMVNRADAYAAVNGGFFYKYGRPSGMVVIDGQVISPGTGRFNSLIINNNEAYFEKIATNIHVEYNNQVIEVDTINEPIEKPNVSALYTSEYGSTDRLEVPHTAIYIKDGIIQNIQYYDSEAPIPEEGYLLSFIDMPPFIEFNKYDEITVHIEPEIDDDTNIYECSSMLVENNKAVAGDYDPWIGQLNKYDPRTCVGILDNGKLAFVVIDGRQPDYSSGVTGRELAQVLVDMGFKEAAMLDGGASSQMIVNKSTVNNISSDNKERILAGGFLIYVD